MLILMQSCRKCSTLNIASSNHRDSSGNSTSTNAMAEERAAPSQKRGENIAQKTGNAVDRTFEDTWNLINDLALMEDSLCQGYSF